MAMGAVLCTEAWDMMAGGAAVRRDAAGQAVRGDGNPMPGQRRGLVWRVCSQAGSVEVCVAVRGGRGRITTPVAQG